LLEISTVASALLRRRNTAILAGMATNKVRFEVPLEPARYAELERVAGEVGCSPRDIARLAIQRLLAGRDDLLGNRVSQDALA
jgi:hypothetical protein